MLALALPLLSMFAPAPAGDEAPVRTLQVAVVVHEGVELLDFAGPGEVFDAASRARDGGAPWFRVFTVAPKDGVVTSQRFVTITPTYSIATCPQPDVLVIPGGDTGRLLQDDAFLAWVKKVAPKTQVTFSVCTGAFVLAKTGLLDGAEATTHWSSVGELRDEAPKATVRENVRFVDNGRVVTTAGVSAGIDGALHVVARMLGRDHAERTARYMEYRWQPEPAFAEKYSKGNPRLDDRARAHEAAMQLHAEREYAKAADAYRALVKSDPKDDRAWEGLGRALQFGDRLDEAVEPLTRAAEFPRTRAKALYNLACIRAVKGDGDGAIAFLTKAVDAGWTDRRHIEGDDDWKALRQDKRYVDLLERMTKPRG